jgi:hypothetical protein
MSSDPIALPGGGFGAAGVVEVLRLPSVDENSRSWEVSRLLGEASALLGECYQSFQWARLAVDLMSIEAAFLSVRSPEQPLGTEIHLLLITRAVGRTAEAGKAWADRLTLLVSNSIGSMGYDYTVTSLDRYVEARKSLDHSVFLQLSRASSLASLELGGTAPVFDFDQLPPMPPDLGRLTSALASSPQCGVFFQLSPTELTPQESRFVGQAAIQLRALSEGSVETGHVGIETARRVADTYGAFEAGKAGPMFEFNALVQGSASLAPALAGRVYAQLYGDDPTRTLRASLYDVLDTLRLDPLGLLGEPWRLHDITTERRANGLGGAHPLVRLPSIATATEAVGLLRLPVLDDRVGVGFEESHATRLRRNYSRGVIGDYDLALGTIRSPGHRIDVGFRLSDLSKHMFVAGTPGSGKTTFTLGVVHQLWTSHRIPTLIIEPAKTEYRALRRLIPDLQIYTPGNSQLAPLALNPFVPPEGVSLERHKSALGTAFAAGVSMVPPLNHLFAEAVDLAYDRAGWFDRSTAADGHPPISVWEVSQAFEHVVADVGYTGEALNVGRAGLVRLRALRRLYDTYRTVSVADLLSQPTVIELAALEHAEHKALSIALLLLNIMSYVHSRGDIDGADLRNVVVLEEAHVLLDAPDRVSTNESDPVGVAKELIRRILAEFRALGVGVVIADQSPRAVGDDVIALTNIKVGFRIVESGDQGAFGSSVGMDEHQRSRLGRLRPGEASVFFDRLAEVEEIVTPDFRAVLGIPTSVPDDEILQVCHEPAAEGPYPECSLVPWNEAWTDVARQIGRAVAQGLRTPGPITTADLQTGIQHAVNRSRTTFPDAAELPAMAVLCFLRYARFDLEVNIEASTIERTLRTVATKTAAPTRKSGRIG